MPLVTKISPQRRRDRYNVFLDEKFAFGVSAETLLTEGLKVGQKLDKEQLDKIIKKEDFAKLFDASLRILSSRPRSEAEIKAYLARKIAKGQNIKFAQAAESIYIAKITEKLRKLKYIDDFEFAKWWTDARVKQAKGPRLIKAELMQKGVDRQLIDNVISSDVSQKALAQKAIEKKIQTWKNLPNDQYRRKVYTYLVSRGFDWETIKDLFAFLQKNR